MDSTLENFINEFFPFEEFKGIGFFTEDLRGNYEAQAERVCKFFGYKTVYEYGSKEIRAHFSYAQDHELQPDHEFEGGRPLHINEKGQLKQEPFITVIPSIYTE